MEAHLFGRYTHCSGQFEYLVESIVHPSESQRMDNRENSARGHRLRALVFRRCESGWPRERHSLPDLLLEEAILAALEPQQLIHPVELLDERLLLHGRHLRRRPS